MRDSEGGSEQDPALWWEAVTAVLRDLAPALAGQGPPRVCVAGTSATVLLATATGEPLGPALMYDDSRSRSEAAMIAACAPADSPALGAGLQPVQGALSPAATSLAGAPRLVLHQADWILGRLTGRYGLSDWNNCLKLGYDPSAGAWPAWLAGSGPRRSGPAEGVGARGCRGPPVPTAVLAATGLAGRAAWPWPGPRIRPRQSSPPGRGALGMR